MASSDTNERRLDLFVEVQYLPSIEGLEVSYELSGKSWMDPIVTYIKDGSLSSNPVEARKVNQPYLKCLGLGDAEYVLRGIHEGVCGNHFGPCSLVN